MIALHPPSSPLTSRRGSALITVALIASVIVLITGSLLRYALSERRLNMRHAARIEARNAAEALAEFGASQIRQKYETRGTFTLNPNGTDALTMPPASFWTGSKVITTASDLTEAEYAPANSTDLELIGGTERTVTTGTSSLYFVNPADENNAGDPLIGKWVTRRDVSVIGRATVTPVGGGRPITAYVSERISVRGAPLFAHAIFYNMDLEIFNGPIMNITGPVHTNGNLFLYPDNQLNFYGNVTASGNIYKAGKPGDNADGLTAAGRNGSINFLNRAGTLVNLKGKDVTRPASSPGSDFWRDSTGGTGTSGTSFANFAANASQVWNGYLQTKDHGIQNYTPVAIGKYVEDPTPSNGTDESVNSGRSIIEAPDVPLGSDANFTAKMEVEKQKYANMAGLYITVTPGTGTISLTSRGLNADGTLKTAKPLTLPTNGQLVRFNRYAETSTTTKTITSYAATPQTQVKSGKTRYRYAQQSNTETYSNTTTTSGTSTTLASTSAPAANGNYSSWSNSITKPANSSSSSTGASSITGGMYDRHRAKPLDLVELDIGALRNAVEEMQKTSGVDPAKAIGNFTKFDWTGIVYVDVQGGPSTRIVDQSSTLKAGSTIAASNSLNTLTSLRVINGTGSAPSFGTANPGLTIATNAPAYIKGHFNADGVTSTSGGKNPATDPDSSSEVPCAIVADAITVLSPGFSDASSKASTANASGSVEVAAALLQGIAPSNKNGNGATSGGAHNIVRFLENWGSNATWFRGSLVCLFESRIFTEAHGSGYYSPPVRNWGFNKLFGQGSYPPGTPRVLSYRRVDFTDLTPAEYAATRDSFNWK
jgi:hypothetical protein